MTTSIRFHFYFNFILFDTCYSSDTGLSRYVRLRCFRALCRKPPCPALATNNSQDCLLYASLPLRYASIFISISYCLTRAIVPTRAVPLCPATAFPCAMLEASLPSFGYKQFTGLFGFTRRYHFDTLPFLFQYQQVLFYNKEVDFATVIRLKFTACRLCPSIL